MSETYVTCPTCLEYTQTRMPVLKPAIREHSDRTAEHPIDMLARYMTGVHARHLSGLPIMPGQAS